MALNGKHVAPFDVQVLNDKGTWSTDVSTEWSAHQAVERARFLLPRTNAVKVIDRQGRQVSLL